MSSRKGSGYEREIAVKLSLWYSEGHRDDVFWRVLGSGGRATNRGRKGKRTRGQYGDIAAMDGFGEPLLDLFTIEIKRGYSGSTISDAFDRNGQSKPSQWEKWKQQVEASWKASGSWSWWLITKRDRRHAVLYMPSWTFGEIQCFNGPLCFHKIGEDSIHGCLLDDFLKYINRDQLEELRKWV